MRRPYLTPANISFIKAHRLEMCGSDMARRFGVSKSVVNRYMRENGLSAPWELQVKWRGQGNIGKTTSTPAIDKILQEQYLKVSVKTLAKQIDKSSTFVSKRLQQLNLTIPDGIIQQRKNDSRIQPGNVSFNKGKKQLEYMTAEAIEKTKGTRFKKGQLPPNTKTDLTISIRPDKRGVNYQFIRIAKANWIPLHRHIWEKVNGKIPAKMKLIFKDGNTMNCALENLELLTPGELMARNSFHNYPKPIALAIQLRGVLNRQINKHLKNIENEK